ncbi:HNH endonuclease signature motif containing protein [Arthrobacter sp. ov118]|uniref:HNH endonuclease signature motif containing protein n=1 Tax=Arthrobacter sp. ov118 TaxID=1761747 RepID=UPI0008E3EFF6|nr:HNH endonuclease signature motif containing protein [Arthrobacter sp. ov118]SFT98861.1 protein of unknown function [Arthrobacter sp. ov118]
MEANGQQDADTVLEDSALEDTALEDSALEDTAAQTDASGFRVVQGRGPLDKTARSGEATDALSRCLALLDAEAEGVIEELARSDFDEAADFAGLAEELAHRVEYYQLLAAAAVDRTRAEGINAAGPPSGTTGWTTGWGTEPALPTPPSSGPAQASAALAGETASTNGAAAPRTTAVWSPADDGCRNTAEFLRVRLQISVGEARSRLALAAAALPRTGIAGLSTPPCQATGLALAAGTIASRAGAIITTALDKVRPIADTNTVQHMEAILVRTAIETDHDFLARIAHRWVDAIDQDGTEPNEEELRHRQGAFLRRPRRGLHHVEIFATTDQYEHLLTVMNTATNPRVTANSGGDGSNDGGTATCDNSNVGRTARPDPVFNDAPPELDRRTRAQQLLDGLVGGCKAALATGTLPATGGLRPQVMVTINYQDLLNRLETTAAQGPRYATHTSPSSRWPAIPGNPQPGTGVGTGTFTYTGPITASTIRKIACDAEIIPVLLGSEGRILDIGRTTRIFPPHIRKALTARDQGCAFPNCTIPAPWCEAHHITYWSHGGTTSTDNGVLLCTHHHHLVHKEQWKIHVKAGIPWFTPPPHIDPRQKPRQNHHHQT